jgi:limonene-1,2-epoxide hydrolase
MPGSPRARTGRRAFAFGALLLTGTALAGCGGKDDDPAATTASTAGSAPVVAPGVSRAATEVVRRWADTLRRGDVDAAATFFAVPSLVANGGPPARLRTRAAILRFNRSLPCGARLVRADRARRGFVIATFVLTERPGPGTCGSGTGATARTAFRVRDGRIVDWLRVQDLPAADTTPA